MRVWRGGCERSSAPTMPSATRPRPPVISETTASVLYVSCSPRTLSQPGTIVGTQPALYVRARSSAASKNTTPASAPTPATEPVTVYQGKKSVRVVGGGPRSVCGGGGGEIGRAS